MHARLRTIPFALAAICLVIATCAPSIADAAPVRDPRTILLTPTAWGQVHRPEAELLFRTATIRDITCARADAKHTVLVYAHAADVPNAYARTAPKLRTEIYRASAFLRLESRTAAPSIDTKLRVLCEAGVPVVHDLALPGPSAASDLGSVRSALAAAGIATDETLAGTAHALVYVDGHAQRGLAGISDGLDDDRLAPDNANLGGGFVSIEFGSASGPFWETLLHELAHSLGAVQASAPNHKAGHCTDGNDTMCEISTPARCRYIAFDCGKDDYFHPAPAPGSYLATHWNLGSALNTYFDRRVIRPDRRAPAAPRAIRSSPTYLVRWLRPSDDTGVVGYRIECQGRSRAWRAVAVTPAPVFDWNRCGGSMRVRAIDAWGRISPPATLRWRG